MGRERNDAYPEDYIIRQLTPPKLSELIETDLGKKIKGEKEEKTFFFFLHNIEVVQYNTSKRLIIPFSDASVIYKSIKRKRIVVKYILEACCGNLGFRSPPKNTRRIVSHVGITIYSKLLCRGDWKQY